MKERISIHKDNEGEILGISINPAENSETQMHEFAVKNLKHAGKAEEFLLFRRGQGLIHVTPGDLLDLRLMYKHGDFPEIIAEGFLQELNNSKRVTKAPARKTQTSS